MCIRDRSRYVCSDSWTKAQLITTNTILNYSKSPMVSNTIVDRVDENVCSSSLSTVTQDNRNFMIVQAEVYEQNSPVLCNRHTCLLYTSRCV